MDIPTVDWSWDASAIRIVDGDTLDVVIDCGFHATRLERIRLLGINCPEMSEVAGRKAKEYTMQWINDAWIPNWSLVIQTHKTDAFGRYLAMIWRKTDKRCLNDDLVAAGHAVPYMVDVTKKGKVNGN